MSAATKVKSDVEAYTNDALPMIDVKKPDEKKQLKVKDVESPRGTQARVDTDSGYNVDVKRAESFAEKMKSGVKFPPVKVMLVDDMPGKKGTPVYVLWDGFHTHAGAEIAKVEAIDALIWKGSWAQALAAAATLANLEHENSGKPKSFKDKLHSLHVYVKALAAAGVTGKALPSNRQLALMFGISHTAVGDEDPCDRRKSGTQTKDEKVAKKKEERAAGKNCTGGVVDAGRAHLNGQPAQEVKRFEIVRRAGNAVVKTVEAESAVKAMEAFKAATPGAVLAEFHTRELTIAPPKPGSEKVMGFDWHKIEADTGSVARGLDGMGDMFHLKDRSEWKTAKANLNQFTEIVKSLRQEVTQKKKAEPKPAETKESQAAKK